MDFLDQVQSGLTIRKIGIEEFSESDAFCGKPLYPGQKLLLKLIFLEELTGAEEDQLDYWIEGGNGGGEIDISPKIRERREWLLERGYEHFREVDLVGGRRASKGFVTGMAGAYKMWNTLNLQDPNKFYGIDRDKNIFFSCVAGSESQAKEMQFADFSGSVESCKAFQPYMQKGLETEFKVATPTDLREMLSRKSRGVKSDKPIARLQGKALAANANTLRGSATIWIVFDEMAHMVSGESKASAERVYEAAMPSLDQFGKAGLAFCNSSPASKVGMFYERFQEAMKAWEPDLSPGEYVSEEVTNGSPMYLGFRYPSWALFEGYRKYKSKWQPRHKWEEVITASPDWDPEAKDEDGSPLYSEGDKIKIVQARADEATKPEVYKVERRGQFSEVIDSYLNAAYVDRMFEGAPAGFDPEGRPFFNKYMTNSGFGANNAHRYRFHLDPSSTQAGFGFAIAHTEEFTNFEGFPETHVVFDMIKRWNPKHFKGNTIDWKQILDEVIGYADIFRPEKITMDQFQSSQPIQTLRMELQKKNIVGVTIELSSSTNENNWFVAETFATALNHGLVHAPTDCKFEEPYGVDQELKFLQKKNTGGKHPRVERQFFGPVTTKDEADCVFTLVAGLIGNELDSIVRQRVAQGAVFGSQGGWNVGGKENPGRPSLLPGSGTDPRLAQFYGSQGSMYGEQRLPRAARPARSSSPARSGVNRRGRGW